MTAPKRFFVCVLAVLPAALFSRDVLGASVELATGLLGGTTNEYVFMGGKTVSTLAWHEQALPAISVSGRLRVWHFFAGLALFSALPLAARSGVMEDFDYLLDDSDAVSHYSRHDLYTDRHGSMAFTLGYTFAFRNFQLEPSAGLAYFARKWSAQDGYLQYPPNGSSEPWDADWPKTSVSGTLISYEQVLYTVFAGVRGAYTIKNRVTLSVSARLYPYIWAEALDSHFIRGAQFLDTMQGGIGTEVEVSAVYYPGAAKSMGFVAGLRYEGIYRLKGTTLVNSIGEGGGAFTPISGSQSGTDSTLFSGKLGIVFNIESPGP
ncbi:MAG: omptin family outer membrane protease [Spirochaetaceae bacterium]|jgi:outer membrane protease|nr:omptin family outer membrane protease [Spirochaetaceae bacterium]